MNTMLFWDKAAGKSHTIKVTQSKQAIWHGQGRTVRQAFRLAKLRGWLHITSKTKMQEVVR